MLNLRADPCAPMPSEVFWPSLRHDAETGPSGSSPAASVSSDGTSRREDGEGPFCSYDTLGSWPGLAWDGADGGLCNRLAADGCLYGQGEVAGVDRMAESEFGEFMHSRWLQLLRLGLC